MTLLLWISLKSDVSGDCSENIDEIHFQKTKQIIHKDPAVAKALDKDLYLDGLRARPISLLYPIPSGKFTGVLRVLLQSQRSSLQNNHGSCNYVSKAWLFSWILILILFFPSKLNHVLCYTLILLWNVNNI